MAQLTQPYQNYQEILLSKIDSPVLSGALRRMSAKHPDFPERFSIDFSEIKVLDVFQGQALVLVSSQIASYLAASSHHCFGSRTCFVIAAKFCQVCGKSLCRTLHAERH